MRKFGYVRVSSRDQSFYRQEESLKNEGLTTTFYDKMTGSKMDRPGLKDLLNTVEENDIVVVVSLDRLGRSLKGILDVLEGLKEKGVYLKTLQENIDTSQENIFTDFLIQTIALVSELQRKITLENQKIGIEKAVREGKFLGRIPKFKEGNEQLEHAFELYKEGQYNNVQICKKTGISKSTFYRKLKEYSISK